MVDYYKIFGESPMMITFHSTFEKTLQHDLFRQLEKYRHIPEWMCISDYAISKGSDKPNRVFTFTFIPNLSFEPLFPQRALSPLFPTNSFYEFLMEAIPKFAPCEIKHTRSVSSNFIWLLNNFPVINISVVLENDKYLSLKNQEDFISIAKHDLESLSNITIPRWIHNEPEREKEYMKQKKKIDTVLRLLDHKKKVSLIKDILLIMPIGAYLSSRIANYTRAKKWCWVSDRDSINDVADHFSAMMFNIYLNEFLEDRECCFFVTPSGSNDSEWYVELTKLPDYITGTLADFNMKNNLVSHDKFIPILRDHIADNLANHYVLKLNFNRQTMCSRLQLRKTERPDQVKDPG